MRKRTIIIIAVVVVLLAVGAYFLFRGKKAPVYEFVSAQKGEVVQEVSVTGAVKPAQDVDLAFEKGGKISLVKANVGDKVVAGQVLVALSNSDLVAQLDQAKASLKVQEASLDELKKGTRAEEISVYQTKVDNAAVSLNEAKKAVVDKINDAYTKSEDAIRNKADQFFTNPRTSNPQFIFSSVTGQLKTDIEWKRFLIESVLNSWNSSLSVLTVSSDLDFNINIAKNNLNQIRLLLDNIALAINSLTPNAALTQIIIDGYKADVSTARANVNTAVANLTAAQDGLSSAQSALTLTQQDLALKKASSTPEQIAGQEAQTEAARANVKNYEAQVAKTILRAPINGIVTKQEAKVGEITAVGAVIVSLISESQFEMEANVPEADIVKIKISDGAKVTLDAYGNDVIFEARVTKIDPAETMIEGVATYKITLQFLKKDERLKSGMTANIDVLTDKRENVISIPQRAVASKDQDKIVKILLNKKTGETSEVKVKTGLRGSDGNIEILEGIKEGDKVVTFEK
ncbi:MAG: efflux RND transporter periplasmic adaptor subunit [Candidatus Paceibacterota bacterium]